MTNAQTLEDMSPGLLKVVERAQREPEGRFNSLAHLIDVPALERASHRQRADAAVGVDGVTKEQYGRNLEANLQDLHARLKDKAVPPSADPTCAHPQSAGENTADWHFGVRGQVGPGRRARGAGGDLRAGLSGLLAWLPTRTQGP